MLTFSPSLPRPQTASLAGRRAGAASRPPLTDAEQRDRWWRHQVAVANSTALGHHSSNDNRVAPLERLRLRRRQARRNATGAEEDEEAEAMVTASELKHCQQARQQLFAPDAAERRVYQPPAAFSGARRRPASAAPRYARRGGGAQADAALAMGVIKSASQPSGEVFGSTAYDCMFQAPISAPEVFAVRCVDSEAEEEE